MLITCLVNFFLTPNMLEYQSQQTKQFFSLKYLLY